MLCGVRPDSPERILWRRKFPVPLVDVWRVAGGKLTRVDLFSRNTVPRRSALLDDDDDTQDDDNPELYVGVHRGQLYIQESILMHKQTEDAVRGWVEAGAGAEVSLPRVRWKPYLVSPGRTPYYDHGRPVLSSEDPTTALATHTAQYPYDSGYYLYSQVFEKFGPVATVAPIISILSCSCVR